MRELVYQGPNRLGWEESAEPVVADPRAAVVRPLAAALCDLDWLIVRGLTPFKPPFRFGHEAIARVVSVGADVRSVKPGDVVCVPFQISCGHCALCAAGQTGNCSEVRPRGAMYGIGATGGGCGGLLVDLALVPFADSMLVRVPGDISPVDVASLSDNVVDGYRCVAPFLEEHPGSEVLVIGGFGASVALYAVASAVALGASRVEYFDSDPGRRARAAELGAYPLERLPEKIVPRYPLVVDVSGAVDRLHAAILSTAIAGTCVAAAMYFGETTPLPLYKMYFKGMRFETGRANARPAIPKVLELIASGRLRPEVVTSRVVTWDEAPDAILAGHETKLIVAREA
jgi:alcohol dehydrogenase